MPHGSGSGTRMSSMSARSSSALRSSHQSRSIATRITGTPWPALTCVQWVRPPTLFRSARLVGSQGQLVTSRCSVKASAGRPICTARWHIASIRPAAECGPPGPPTSQDHSLCTCPSPVRPMLSILAASPQAIWIPGFGRLGVVIVDISVPASPDRRGK